MMLKIKPLSVNRAWQGKRFKTNEYKMYELELMSLLPKVKIEFRKKLSLNIVFGFSSKSSDVDNPLKPLLDCLQKKYKFNDKNIYHLDVTKEIVKKGKEFIKININEF